MANVASAIKNAARTVEEIGAEIENNARPSNEIGYITQASELHITVPSLPDRKVVHPAVKDSFLAQVETVSRQYPYFLAVVNLLTRIRFSYKLRPRPNAGPLFVH